jgi:hypothetical protein
MIGLTNHVRVTVIRNAAGLSYAPIATGCGPRALTHPASSNISYKLPSSCAANSQDLYDPKSKSRKIIQIMNFYNAPSTNFTVFDSTDFNNELDVQCELQDGDDIYIVWTPLLDLPREALLAGIQTRVLPLKRTK